MSVSSDRRPLFDDPDLQRKIMRLRRVDNLTNVRCLAREYACLIAVIGGAVAFAESRAGWGLDWVWNVPVFALAIALVGGLQHRLAGLGHEASHFTFVKNRFMNDLIPDIFCMFPIFTTVHFYRVFHMAHHQYTNDPVRDPDLLNLGHGKRAFEFPMTRSRFIAVVYFCMVVAPIRFLQYQWAYFTVNTLGKGRSIYTGTDRGNSMGAFYVPRPSTALGISLLLVLNGVLWTLTYSGNASLVLPAAMAALALGLLGAFALPARAFFASPFRQAYSSRFAGMARLTFFVCMITALALLRVSSSGRSSLYFILLWMLPIGSSFPFYMFLRDVYQHSNADRGRLTNSRVFFTDPFTRWAVFVYGQDMHIPHHLFPAIPHYQLGELHQMLKQSHADYGDAVVECHGTFHDPAGRPTILDEMTRFAPPDEATRRQPSPALSVSN